MDPTYGKYRAQVVDRDDPEGRGRINVEVPTLTAGPGGQVTGWAMACLPPGYLALPDVGDTVWVEFEEGDIDRPLWTGCAWPGPADPRSGCLVQIDVSGKVRILADTGLEVVASTVTVTSAVLEVTGQVKCTTLIASEGVVSPSYTPGAGNVW